MLDTTKQSIGVAYACNSVLELSYLNTKNCYIEPLFTNSFTNSANREQEMVYLLEQLPKALYNANNMNY